MSATAHLYDNSGASPTLYQEGGEEDIYPKAGGAAAARSSSKKKIAVAAGIVALLAVLGIALGVGLGVGLKDKDKSASAHGAEKDSAEGADSSSHSPPTSTVDDAKPTPDAQPKPDPTYFEGKTGSMIKMDDGKDFTFRNDLGGDWAYDVKYPFHASGRAQEGTPRVNETWDYEKDRIRGVNLGGWLVTERE